MIRFETEGRPSNIGFPVRRLLPGPGLRSVGPFIFLDHMGPARFQAGTTEGDVRPHPHIGLSTFTYLFEGAMQHRDSLGTAMRIEPGAVNLMTAGRGIVHSERFPADLRAQGETVQGIQMWLALPCSLEECAPSFEHTPRHALPCWVENGAHTRLLAGEAWGARSPVTTHLATFCAAVELEPGAQISLPVWPERAVYLLDGTVHLGAATAHGPRLLVPETAGEVRLVAHTFARLMLIGGEPPDGPRYLDWNFVSSRRDRLQAAREAWQAGHFAPIPGETEFIPLPGTD
ncbi:pirin family protein [Gulbenkiania mobilis]|uniref:pirin family protein n=1 Tax=Gulbenkiania mobilis TaxID=397457 RepID=UPI0006BBCEDB|nr:pirin family protein [Gulbenkiania mobilis]